MVYMGAIYMYILLIVYMGAIYIYRWPRALEPLVIRRTSWQIFQSIAPATNK